MISSLHRFFPIPATLLAAGLLVPALSAEDTRKDATDTTGHPPLRLQLPPVLYALPGLESNLYFDTAFLAFRSEHWAVDVISQRGAQQEQRWTWVPSTDPEKKDIGEHRLALEIRDPWHRVVDQAETVIRVGDRAFSTQPESPYSLLIIGDSLTNASVYSGRILELAQEDQLPLRLVGTRGPGAEAQADGGDGSGNRHEGYGGWTAERFATHYTGIARGGEYTQCGSPFLYKGEGEPDDAAPQLDFRRYYEEFNEGKAPDWVTILLGCNDTFHATDENIEERIDTMFLHYERLLKEILAQSPGTRVGVVLPMPPSRSQDAFAASYGSGQTRWQYRRNQHRTVERMLATFSGREQEGVFLVPAYLQLDPVDGFPARAAKAHTHTEKDVERASNGVHPSAEGYRQMGDAMYAWLRAMLADRD